jgi:hypothetical protein
MACRSALVRVLHFKLYLTRFEIEMIARAWHAVSLAVAVHWALRIMDALILETEQRIEALKLRLPSLEGKANKKERTQVNKDIYTLENDEEYVAAIKARVEEKRAQSAAADDAAHAAKLAEERAAAAALQKASGNNSSSVEMYERHFRQQVEQLFDEVTLHTVVEQ